MIKHTHLDVKYRKNKKKLKRKIKVIYTESQPSSIRDFFAKWIDSLNPK